MNSFADFGLISSLVKTLKEKHLNKPTEIQINTIPILVGGMSVVGVAETGSGKTLAYALPILNALKSLETQDEPVNNVNAPRALVMVPTRELGEQVSKVFKTFTHDTRLRVRSALGGMTLAHARRNADGPFEILIATPGRLVQMIERELIDLSDVRFLIFDEADQMMDQGFLPDSNLIAETCPQHVQMALFSATVSPPVQELINTLFSKAEVIRSQGSGKVVSSLTTKNLVVEDGKRWPLFEKVLKQKVEGGTIIFSNTREQCDKLAAELNEKGYACVMYRGEMDKNERRQNLRKFRDGQVEFLVATDLAGRGLDIDSVGRVINYHLPKQMENYLHRVGRTARAGRKGLVVNLVTERDNHLITKLGGEKLVFKSRQEIKQAASVADTRPVAAKGRSQAQRAQKAVAARHADKPAARHADKQVASASATAGGKRGSSSSSRTPAKASYGRPAPRTSVGQSKRYGKK